jgi:Leu/Phe-tRNA-protein transferase
VNTVDLRYSPSGHVVLLPGDDADAVVDGLLEAGYLEEFCLSPSFDVRFVASLMAAGFLVMAFHPEPDMAWGSAILLPKLHLDRAVLELDAFHEPRSIQRLLKRYELRVDVEFDTVMEKCAAIHGDDWLTAELRDAFRGVRALSRSLEFLSPDASVRSPFGMLSFALFRNGSLVAGEFGAVAGGVYTSYSGYREESSAGTVQMILTARYLRNAGFSFWDLGMPMEYKAALGAQTIARQDFVFRFREARAQLGQSKASRTVRA